MGCGSSSSSDDGDFAMLGVISFFPCVPLKKAKFYPYPQLLVGRITSSNSLISPYSCQKCVIYRVDCYFHKHDTSSGNGGWERVYSDVRSVDFSLRDPDDTSRAVHIRGKRLTVKYFNTEMNDDFHDDAGLTELTPSISALLSRSGLQDSDLSDVRIREYCVEENTQVGIFGVLCGSNTGYDDQMQMNPVCIGYCDDKDNEDDNGDVSM